MPIIPVQINDIEKLDSKLVDMCKKESAVLIQDGGVFSNIFPKAMDRSRVFRKRYGIASRSGRLLFVKLIEISLYFNYRDNYGEIQFLADYIEKIESIFPEIKTLFIESLNQNRELKYEQIKDIA